jgi:hypothetical protein
MVVFISMVQWLAQKLGVHKFQFMTAVSNKKIQDVLKIQVYLEKI